MPIYKYKARTRRGIVKEGKVDANTEELAMAQLAQKGMTVMSLKDVNAILSFQEQLQRALGIGAVQTEDLLTFSRQMQTMMRSGVAIMRSLQIVEGSTKSPELKAALRQISIGLEGGKSLAQAMQEYRVIFPQIMVSMVHVAETTGNFDEAFKQISQYISNDMNTRRKVKAATRYPMFVFIAITAAIVIINIFVIPSFEKFFGQFGAELPMPTKILMACSNFTKSYGLYILFLIIAAIFWFIRYKNSEEGALKWSRLTLKMPIMGPIFEQALLSRFSRSLAMTLSAGVPLLQALAIVSKAMDNAYMQQRIMAMRAGLERGESLVQTAKESELFTPLVMQMLMIGEETGEVDAMLRQVSETYDIEVEYALSRLSASIEPILIGVIACIVLVLALGIFLPMWNMSSMVH